MKQTLLLALLVGSVTMLAHWPSLDARALTFDDDEYLVNNPFMRAPSWHGLGRFWTEIAKPSTVPGYYQPLTMTSLMIDAALGGRPSDLRPFHRTSLLLHAMNAILVFVLLLYLLVPTLVVQASLPALESNVDPMPEKAGWKPAPQPMTAHTAVAAALAAMLFGVHPLAVESICWVGERKTLLATGLVLISILFYIRHARGQAWRHYFLSIFFFILALTAKPSVMPLPFILLLMDVWPLRRLDGRALIEKTPFLLVALTGGVVAYISQSNTYGVTLPVGEDSANPAALFAHNIAFYLIKAIGPTVMSAYYPFPRPLDFTNGMVLAGAIAIPALVLVALIARRWTPSIAIGLGLFVIAILPAIGLIGFHPVIAADRHLYFPILGLLLPIAVLFDWLLRRKSYALPVVATIAFVLLTRQTRQTIAHWRDTTSLFTYFVQHAPNAPAPHARLGAALLAQAQPDAAIPPLKRSLELRPNQPHTLRRLGEAQMLTGQAAEGVKSFEAAHALRPQSFIIVRNLAWGQFAVGEYEAAARSFQIARTLKPNDAALLHDLRLIQEKLRTLPSTLPTTTSSGPRE